MAVDTSPSTFPTIDEYILSAYKRSGLLPIEADIGFDISWNAKAAHGRKTLNRIVEELATEGFIDHFSGFETLTLVANDGLYTLDSDILNVIDVASYIPASNGSETEETTGETPIHPMTKHAWNQLSSKDFSGTPTRYFFDRNGFSNEIRFWPLPNEAGKARLRVHRIPGSNSTGSNNVDLKRHWGMWIVNALAVEFMMDSQMPADSILLVRNERDNLRAKIKGYETSNEGPDIMFCHSSPWSGMGQ